MLKYLSVQRCKHFKGDFTVIFISKVALTNRDVKRFTLLYWEQFNLINNRRLLKEEKLFRR